MSTRKTPDNATLPEPIVSPGRELRRQQAKGRKVVATAQSRGARRAKEIAPKKPKPESKADEPKKPYEMTPAEEEAAQRVSDRRKGRPPAPRIASLRQDGTTAILCFEHADPKAMEIVLMDALGVSEPAFGDALLRQITDVARNGANLDPTRVNAMIAGIAAMRPRDEAEAMLIAQMIATHELAMTFTRRLALTENIPQHDSAVNGLTKLTRTYAAQMAALKHYRTGGEQRVIVQRVDVREGGQAVVGVVNSERGGRRPRTKSRASPCKADGRCTKRRGAVRHRSGAGFSAKRQR